MSRKRYTAEQIIGHLRQAEVRTSEGKTVAEAVRELGISEQTRSGNTVGEWHTLCQAIPPFSISLIQALRSSTDPYSDPDSPPS